jgi:hypothetical protein
MKSVISADEWSQAPAMAKPQKLQRTMEEFPASRLDLSIADSQVPSRPVVVDLTQTVEREAQNDDAGAANLIRACEAGVIRDNGVPPPPGIIAPPQQVQSQ